MPSPPLVLRTTFLQGILRESAPTMDHLFRAQAKGERILTGEVFNLVQHDPAWIKSAIIPPNNCPAASGAVRRFGNALSAD